MLDGEWALTLIQVAQLGYTQSIAARWNCFETIVALRIGVSDEFARRAITFEGNDRVCYGFILRIANCSFDDCTGVRGAGLAAACGDERCNQRQKDARDSK